MKRMTSLVGKGFQPAKCKTQLRLGSARIKLLRNKKGIQIAADRREVADFLRNGQESNARLRVEHIIREQNLIEAFDLLFLYAERIAAQVPVIDSQKTCPPELKEDISTLLYASARCAELPDFAQIRPMFTAKYGKEFVSAIEELRPGCGVNGRVIEKLSVSRASGEAKLQVMKDIAAEHNVNWDPAPFEKELRAGPNDLLDGPSKIISVEDFDDFPTVPSQKPILTQPDNFTNLTSGRFMEAKVEPKNSPRPADDFRTSSQGGRTGPPVDDFRTVSQGGRAGPPTRKPPGLSPPRAEDPPFDTEMDPGARETLPRRSSRRESDSFTALSRPQEEESRRNSIGVPREKTGRANIAPVFRGIDESPPKDYIKHNRRGSIDEFDGSHRAERRQSQKHDGNKFSSDEDEHGGFVKPRPGTEKTQARRAQNLEEDNYGTVSGSGTPRSHKRDDEEFYKKVPSREKYEGRAQLKHTSDEDEHGGFAKSGPGTERIQTRRAQDLEEDNYSTVSGSGKPRSHKQDDEEYYESVLSREKGRAQQQDQEPGEQKLRWAPSREGSGKGRTHNEVQYAEEQNLRRSSSKEGSGSKIPSSSGEESRRSKEGSQYAGKYRRHDYSDDDADHIPEPPRRRDASKNAPNYVDEDADWDIERFKKSVTTRNPEDEYRDSPRGTRRESLNMKAGASPWGDDNLKKTVTTRNPEAEYRDSPRGTRRESLNMKAGASPWGDDNLKKPVTTRNPEDEYRDSPRGTRRESLNMKAGASPWGDDNLKKPVTTRNPEAEYRDSPRDTRRESLNMKAGASPWGDDNLKKPVTTRNPEDEYCDSPRGTRRESLNTKAGVSPRGEDNGKRPFADDTSVRRSNLGGRRTENERFTPQYDSSEPEDDPRGRMSGSRKPSNNFHTDRSSESGEEGSRQSRRTPRLPPSVNEQRKDSPRGSRYGREDAAPKNSRFDNDEALTTSSRTEMRMSLPGDKYRPSEMHDDTVRSSNRRATIGPEEITRGARETEDRREKEKHSDRRQSLPKNDMYEGRHSSSHASQRDRSDRRRLSDDDDRPPRFLPPKVDDERSPRRERPERPRKNISPRYDDDNPPPRFIKVGKQDDQDSLKLKPQQPTPRPRPNLQTHKTDPDLPKTPKVEHRKSQSASDGQPPSKPVYMKPPDLDVLLKIFADKKK